MSTANLGNIYFKAYVINLRTHMHVKEQACKLEESGKKDFESTIQKQANPSLRSEVYRFGKQQPETVIFPSSKRHNVLLSTATKVNKNERSNHN